MVWAKELSLCHKFWIYNPYFFRTQCRKSLILQTYIIWSNRIHSLKYLRSTTWESKDIGFRKAEFVAKTQFLTDKYLREIVHIFYHNDTCKLQYTYAMRLRNIIVSNMWFKLFFNLTTFVIYKLTKIHILF